MNPKTALLVFVKYPEPGQVKTRLAVSIGDQKAAAVYRLFAETCMQRYQKISHTDCIVYCTPKEEKERIMKWLGHQFIYDIQPEGDLGQRLTTGFQTQLQQYAKVIALGTDSPDLPSEYIEEAIASLEDHDTVVGPCNDGGYYLIGMKSNCTSLFQDIEWSTNLVLYQTLMNAKEHHISMDILPGWYDVDTKEEFNKLLADNLSIKTKLQSILSS